MMLSYIYLVQSGNTELISNLQFETKSGRKYRETIYKGNLILDSIKGISHSESLTGVTNSKYLTFCKGNYIENKCVGRFMCKISIFTKYHLFRRNLMGKITNNNLP